MENYWTPAHQAVELEDTETLARLLADGGDPDEVFSTMTLLTHALDAEGDGALQRGKPPTVHTTAVLLAFGADPELPDPDGRTPMDVAVTYNHDLAVKLLQAYIGRRACRCKGSALMRALRWVVRLPSQRGRPQQGSRIHSSDARLPPG
ncbi:ankyrin repeat domain-containing protein [Streptomyces sp. NPDC051098]|uniref:ankyrin repeat domain-containing protein n=1 Tax=Streptomyces sp. NPDC051098 TaxID=3155411 RepID=UPI00342EAE2D